MSIENIKQWAIETTHNAKWKESKFHQFIKVASHEEFLNSQVPFFNAVQAFPRMLCKLAMNIEESNDRLLVVENIYEEHGRGNSAKFHTNTYTTYLNALGWNSELKTNPWVEQWNNKVLNLNYESSEYAAYLSAIEYLYALISHDVSNYLQTLTLLCEQHHYANHALLDWEHGYELLSVALSLSKEKKFTIEMENAFIQGQKDFLEMYNHLFMPTSNEMREINKEKIAFYFIREDSEIENTILNNNKSEKIDILSIASGGEHIFEYMKSDRFSQIDVIDINPHQLCITQQKLENILNYDEGILCKNDEGKFEKIFSLLREYLSKEDIILLEKGDSKSQEKLQYIVYILFSNKYLNIVFGEEATKYTVKNFGEHFYTIFKNKLIEGEKNTCNIFKETPIRDYKQLSILLNKNKNKNKHTLSWNIQNPQHLVTSKTYDMINISNIGDWMSLVDYIKMIAILKNNLKQDGCIVARKLLGDYCLKDIFEESGLMCEQFQDNTYFYSETIAAYKK